LKVDAGQLTWIENSTERRERQEGQAIDVDKIAKRVSGSLPVVIRAIQRLVDRSCEKYGRGKQSAAGLHENTGAS